MSGQYRHPSGWFARVDLIGYGKLYFYKTNQNSRDPYELVNAKIDYEGKRFDIYLYGKNIFDTEYNSVGVRGGYFTVYSDPGEVGVQFNLHF